MKYHVEFTGELKDDVDVQKIFLKQYNRWVDLINSKQTALNDEFDRWFGLLDDYQTQEYTDWMVRKYKVILNDSKLKKDILFKYYIDDELQFYGVGRLGIFKDKRIGFVLKEG